MKNTDVAKACKIMGVSRDTFYRYQELSQEGGIDALINKSRHTPNVKNRVDEATEQAVLTHGLEQPAHGQHRTSNELRKKGFSSREVVSAQFGCDITLKISKNVSKPWRKRWLTMASS